MKFWRLFLLMAISIAICCCSQHVSHKRISPLPSGISIDAMTDCMVPASFTNDDFGWMGGNLTMTVYNEDLYDAVEISQMQVGDTLIYESKPMVIAVIEDDNGTISVNGGVEEGGCWLQGYEGGTYRAVTFDDHSIYTKIGEVQVPLADDFIIIDCGDNPTDPIDTIRSDQKLYLETLEGYRKNFTLLNTRVLIEDGVITEIKRRWIP